jgi:proteasome accessory factor B
VVAIRSGKAPALARRAEPMDLASAGIELPGGFAVYRVGYTEVRHLAEEIARYAADVVVVQPLELRQAVIDHLTAVVGTVREAEAVR